MKVTAYTFLWALVALGAPKNVFSNEDSQETTQVYDGWTIKRFSTEDAIKEMAPFLSSSEDIPSHLQYVIGLGQSGLVGSWNRLPVADPEFGAALSGGKFTKEGKKLKQVINRCAGDGWTFFDYDSTSITTGEKEQRFLTATGKDFFSKINEDEDMCNLIFTWNKDRTKAVITGYFPEDLSFVDSLLSIEIQMLPYWKWKFGLKTSWLSFKNFKSLDKKCCPPKNGNDMCSGKGTIGKKGSTCETISMACDEVAPEDVTQCALMRRINLGAGFIPAFGYEVYALADKNGLATPFEKYYSKAVIDAGVSTLFQGIGENESISVEANSVESEGVPENPEL